MAVIDNLENNRREKQNLRSDQGFITYIKPVITEQGSVYAVCTEDGVELALFPTREAAVYSARQFNLLPMSMH